MPSLICYGKMYIQIIYQLFITSYPVYNDRWWLVSQLFFGQGRRTGPTQIKQMLPYKDMLDSLLGS